MSRERETLVSKCWYENSVWNITGADVVLILTM